jgi:hypothetical protein
MKQLILVLSFLLAGCTSTSAGLPSPSLPPYSAPPEDTSTPSSPEPIATAALDATDAKKLNDKGWVLEDFQPRQDGLGGLTGVARVKNANFATSTAVFTITVLKNGRIAATFQGSANGVEFARTVTIQLVSQDAPSSGPFRYEFQADASVTTP